MSKSRLSRLMCSIVLAFVIPIASADNSQRNDAQDFLFPYSDRKLIRERDLLDADERVLWQARNEIYARKGYRFTDTKTRRFFEARKYYRPTVDDVPLTSIEKSNVATIRRFERYLSEYPEAAFESSYQVLSGSKNRKNEVTVRECPSERCRSLGKLHSTCTVITDMRMDKPAWVYVRSSVCGATPGAFGGYVRRAMLRLIAG